MIIKATNESRRAILNFLYNDPIKNFSLIQDIEFHDLNYLSVYLDVSNPSIEDKYKIDACLIFNKQVVKMYVKNIYYNNYEELSQAILTINAPYFQGCKSTIDPLFIELNYQLVNKMYYSILNKKHNNIDMLPNMEVTLASKEEDYLKIAKLLNETEEYNLQYNYDKIKQENEQKIAMYFYIRDENQYKCCARITNITSKSAMISLVTVDKDYRNRGIATKMINYLSNYIVDLKLFAIILYDEHKYLDYFKELGFNTFDEYLFTKKIHEIYKG